MEEDTQIRTNKHQTICRLEASNSKEDAVEICKFKKMNICRLESRNDQIQMEENIQIGASNSKQDAVDICKPHSATWYIRRNQRKQKQQTIPQYWSLKGCSTPAPKRLNQNKTPPKKCRIVQSHTLTQMY
eukprot:984185_1